MSYSGIVILIPAYQPPDSLLTLVENIASIDSFRFVIVNDGSSETKNTLFDHLSMRSDTIVIPHSVNQGKGQALKTGINHILVEYPKATGIVTVDADGQHLPTDVAKVAQALSNQPHNLCLGVRHFKGVVPLRSRVGNALTKALFRLCSGKSIMDTQTGLRGLPIDFARQILSVDANGYEFEFKSLFEACGQERPIVQVVIETVYDKGNPTSHFNPFLDSLKIYFVFIRFISSSLMVSFIDMVTFAIAFYTSGQLLGSMIAGRICAGLSQFFLSKHFVFNSKQNLTIELIKYIGLVALLLAVSYNIIEMATANGFSTYLSKIIVDTLLFFTSFALQRVFVFKRKV